MKEIRKKRYIQDSLITSEVDLVFRELKSKLEGLETTAKKKEGESKWKYYRTDTTIFKTEDGVTLLGLQKSRQMIKIIKSKTPKKTFSEVLQVSIDSVKERTDIPVNYQTELLNAFQAYQRLSAGTIDAIMESDDEIHEATIHDLVNF